MNSSSAAKSTAAAAAAVVAVPLEVELSPAPQARTPTWIEYVSVAAFFVVSIALSAKVFQAVRLGSGLVVALTGVAGFVAADFFSGLVHWAFDTWGSPDTPVLGKAFIVPFRVHHSDPVDITRHGFIATNGHNCLVTLPVLAAILFLDVRSGWGAGVLTFLMAASLGTFGTNQFHKWAHQAEVGAVVGFLQRHHLVLNPDHHDIHHTRPYDQHYCITTGWLNPILRAVRFYRGAEWLITRVTGAQPRRDDLTTA
jgi:plasmanylethanolamine desaturase